MALPAPPETGKFRILVAEDDSSIARLILATLKRAGFDCRYAPDGIEALKVFKECDPHLVLTDIMMPGMNGHDLCVKIREISTVPVIMMTAADTEDAQMKGFKGGADDYVSKPFNPKTMTARVIAHLRRVYRYDFSESSREESEDAMPAGWGKCESCGYMGPRDRFGTRMEDDTPVAVCPVCRSTNKITYSVA